MIQVRLVPAPVEPVVLVKVAQLLRQAEHLEPVVQESVEPRVLAEARAQVVTQVSVAQVVQQSQLVLVAQAAASETKKIIK
jgi:hypothetical protein